MVDNLNISFTFTVDTLIALVALLLGIGSSIYTWLSNRYSIDLFHEQVDVIHGNKLISFTIANTSSKPLRISDVKLYLNVDEIVDNGFDPVEYENERNDERIRQWDEEHTMTLPFGYSYNAGINPYKLNFTKALALNQSSDNFSQITYLMPSEECSFSYYVDKLPTHILVTSDKKIFRWKNERLFSIVFN